MAGVDVLAPRLRSQREIVSEKRLKVGRSFAGQHALHYVLMVCVSLGLTQKDPAAGLRAENVISAFMRQHVGRIVVWSSGAQGQLAEIAKGRQGGPKH